ncbi:hypothetical protein DL766_002371 [Monosporascus sp. MC13-8B]|uniref:Derlin n=1 Tax=Monosporascus cannonballus TaxID=155416 RepID=A0ABY0HFU6_9PEZI|nr:hypothetical protein DL762_001582 [Monosporascus cannonballus]RYP00301.1 hypothetical protein DL763_000912 [Monosporascus cannonballus]RYP35718.1 hypothetical protein DL766_002371 [Monosporascus sp. MC13-8B]
MSDVASFYWAAPPVSRTVATAVFACSVAVYTGMISAYPFLFHYSTLLQFPPAVHRLVTSFLLTGPGLSVLFETYFIYSYLSQVEKGNSKFSKREDLVWYLMFVGGVIITLNQIFTGAVKYLPALLIAVCYTATQDKRGQTAHFYIVTVPAQMLPYCMLLLSILLDGPNSFFVGLTGLVSAHLHDFLVRLYPEFGNGPNLIPTPGFLSYLVGTTPRVRNTSYGQKFAPRSSGSQSGPLPDSWRSKGPGRRLG